MAFLSKHCDFSPKIPKDSTPYYWIYGLLNFSTKNSSPVMQTPLNFKLIFILHLQCHLKLFSFYASEESISLASITLTGSAKTMLWDS